MEPEVPQPQELFKLCQFLAFECEKLRGDVEVLKLRERKSASARRRAAVLDPARNPVPESTFEDWWRATAVDARALREVRREDLLAGMKAFLHTEIERRSGNFPLRVFSLTPPVVLQAYSQQQLAGDAKEEEDGAAAAAAAAMPQRWRRVSAAEWSAWVEALEHRFLQEYMRMLSAADARDDGGEAALMGMLECATRDRDREVEMRFMLKISDSVRSAPKRAQELRKWLLPLILQDLDQ